jgi:teichuronic acid exporter
LENLRSKIISGGLWSSVEVVGSEMIRLVISVILARLLSPSDFGLMGMLAIFFAVSNSAVQGGFGWALIQNDRIKTEDYLTVFWLNLSLSIAFYFLLFFSAPAIAVFYNEPALTNITRVASLSIVFTSLGIVQNSYFSRNLSFKIPARIRLLSLFISGSLGVVLAFSGFGVWALVWQLVTNTFLLNILFWVKSDIKLSFVFLTGTIKNLSNYGGKMLFGNILNQIGNNVFAVFIGKYFNPVELGYFTQARKFQSIPTTALDTIVRKITFPLFSNLKLELDKMQKAFHLALNVSSSINMPVLVGILITAKLWVPFLLGSKWNPIIPYLQLYCIDGLFYPLIVLNSNVIASVGDANRVVKLKIYENGSLVLVPLFTYKIGITYMILSKIAISVIIYLISVKIVKRYINTSLSIQFKAILPVLISSLLMVVSIILIGCLGLSAIFTLVLQLLVGFISYVAIGNYLQLEIIKNLKFFIKGNILHGKRKK